MVYNDLDIEEYPYSGAFYSYTIDEDAPLDERVPIEILVEEIPHCDIQRQGARRSGTFLGAGYTVYYPLQENPEWDGIDEAARYMPIRVRRGMKFKGGDPLYPVEGTVEFIRFSQLGQASIDIKVSTESDI